MTAEDVLEQVDAAVLPHMFWAGNRQPDHPDQAICGVVGQPGHAVMAGIRVDDESMYCRRCVEELNRTVDELNPRAARSRAALRDGGRR